MTVTKTNVAALKETIDKQQKIIVYMRNTVKAYIDVYLNIGQRLEAADDDADEEEIMAQMDDLVMQCHDLLQPVLTLWEDTKPENIDETLAGHGTSQIKRIFSSTIN